jgi:ribosomal protein S18 acetylase RimI-like enzyme
VEAYQHAPAPVLHPEVRTPENALEFIARTAAGGYGVCRPEYLRIAKLDGGSAGFIAGCELFPGTGFVLQLAVRSAYRRRGVAAGLIRDLCRQFEKAGLRRIALGVTLNNPVKHLYDALGFSGILDTDAFFWWRTAREADGTGA